jgi:hypothetical protein
MPKLPLLPKPLACRADFLVPARATAPASRAPAPKDQKLGYPSYMAQ